MLADSLIDGYGLFSDWMFVVAIVLAVAAAVLLYVRQAQPRDWRPSLLPLSLAFGWLAFLVL